MRNWYELTIQIHTRGGKYMLPTNAQRVSRRSRVLILIVLIVACSAVIWVSQTLARRFSNRLEDYVRLPCNPRQMIQPFREGVLFYDGMELKYVNEHGDISWVYKLGAAGNYRLQPGGITAWSGNRLFVINKDLKTVLDKTMSDTILSASVSDVFVAIQTGEEEKSSITLLDLHGNLVDTISLSNQIALDFGFFSNGEFFWDMLLDTKGTVPMCTVNTYKPGIMQTGAIVDSEQVVDRVLFSDSKIKVVGTNYIRTYDYKGKELSDPPRQLVYGWHLQDARELNKALKMLFVRTTQADGILRATDLRLIDETSESSVHLPAECFAALAGDRQVYAFATKYLFACEYGKSQTSTYVMPVAADRVLGLTSNNRAIIVSGDDVYLVRMP